MWLFLFAEKINYVVELVIIFCSLLFLSSYSVSIKAAICEEFMWVYFRFFFHISVEYLFTFWTCFILYKEYGKVASMRLNFLASQGRRAEQFTVSLTSLCMVCTRKLFHIHCENDFIMAHESHAFRDLFLLFNPCLINFFRTTLLVFVLLTFYDIVQYTYHVSGSC